MLRILALSDTHEQHFELELPSADLLLYAGDSTWQGYPYAVEAFNKWLGEQTHIAEKVIIAGNHDFWFESHPEYARKAITNATYLQDESCYVNDVHIYGTPWQPFYYNWAFQCETEEELGIKFSKIPKDTDILVSHCPPYGILDQNKHAQSIGSKILGEWIVSIRPKVVIFGHNHEGYGHIEKDGTHYINVATCDHHYRPINKPVLFDYNGKDIKFIDY
jgi:Icc-related predicted phosphoesterase